MHHKEHKPNNVITLLVLCSLEKTGIGSSRVSRMRREDNMSGKFVRHAHLYQ